MSKGAQRFPRTPSVTVSQKSQARHRVEAGIGAAPGDQIRVAAFLDYPALIENQDPSAWRIVDSRWAMTMVVRPAMRASVAA